MWVVIKCCSDFIYISWFKLSSSANLKSDLGKETQNVLSTSQNVWMLTVTFYNWPKRAQETWIEPVKTVFNELMGVFSAPDTYVLTTFTNKDEIAWDLHWNNFLCPADQLYVHSFLKWRPFSLPYALGLKYVETRKQIASLCILDWMELQSIKYGCFKWKCYLC